MVRRMLSALPLVVLLSCGGGESTAPTTGGGTAEAPADRRDSLIIAYNADIENMIPVVAQAAHDTAIYGGNLFYPTIDSEFDCSLKKVPGLAKSWSWSEDGKVLALELRDDITWADGKPVTAEDIAFTYELVADKNVASPRISYIERMVEGKRPLIVDPTHIEFHFTEAYDRDTQISHVSLDVVPKHILESADRTQLKGTELNKKPLSSGPWTLAKHDVGQRIVLEPNEHFTGPAEQRPKLNRVVYKVIPEYSTRLLELQNGTVDLMESIMVEDADMLRESAENIKLERRGWRFLDYVGWNLQNEKFADPKVRKALAHAANVDDLIAKLLTSNTGESYGRAAVGTITPELCGVHNDDIVPFANDLDKAKMLFEEAGWTDSDGDGWLDKGGKKFSFTLTTNSGNKRRQQASVILQAQFKEVGVEMNIEQQETNVFFENLRKKEFEAALAGWSAGLFVDPSTIWHSDTEEKTYQFNFVSYSNPKADELMDRGLRTPDPKEAAPIWKELQQVIYDDQPYLFLFWRDDIVGIDKRFENTTIDVLSPYKNLHEWSVPADKVKYQR